MNKITIIFTVLALMILDFLNYFFGNDIVDFLKSFTLNIHLDQSLTILIALSYLIFSIGLTIVPIIFLLWVLSPEDK